MVKKALSYDIAAKTASGAVNLTRKMLDGKMPDCDKVWVVSGLGGGILLLPFDARVGIEDQVDRFLAEVGAQPAALPSDDGDIES
jgi:hypothetical protein